MKKIDLKSMLLTELEEFLKQIGEPGFRAKQVFSWLHEKKVRSFDEMTNLSKSLRDKLSSQCRIPLCSCKTEVGFQAGWDYQVPVWAGRRRKCGNSADEV